MFSIIHRNAPLYTTECKVLAMIANRPYPQEVLYNVNHKLPRLQVSLSEWQAMNTNMPESQVSQITNYRDQSLMLIKVSHEYKQARISGIVDHKLLEPQNAILNDTQALSRGTRNIIEHGQGYSKILKIGTLEFFYIGIIKSNGRTVVEHRLQEA